jgi:hypothetical protein
MYLYRRKVRLLIGSGLVIWVNPRRINFHAGSSRKYRGTADRMLSKLGRICPPTKTIAQRIQDEMPHYQPFFIGRDRFVDTIPIEEERRYTRIQDLLNNIENPEESIWYKELSVKPYENGVARHKHLVFRSGIEIYRFLEDYIGNMVRSMMESGYDPDKAPDTGEAIIDINGQLLKTSSGNHRFAVARILGLSSVPLEIVGAHEDWLGATNTNREMRELELAIRKIEYQNR